MKVNLEKLLQKIWAYLQKFNIFNIIKRVYTFAVNNYQFINTKKEYIDN